ncbi:ricin-type beta-trefoil lectin domain protein [Alkalimarinus coralli]|uniref:ricin-type beta-trefoil lectin domain protein n=1 Tax=Alkalimarinus coralli TaxID=2935863 RepID=UPI00202AF7AE|nr:ricin-type beta-trefoil lectin domain protein [Alkalimarinus coralli]
MKLKHLSPLILGCSALVSSWAQAASNAPQDHPVYSLAQGCYSVQSPHNGRYMRAYYSGGSINDGRSYDFRASSIGDAAKFFMKPSSLGHFRPYNVDGRYLDTRFPADITAGTVSGKHSNWRVDYKEVNGEYLYRFNSHALDKWLRHNWSSEGIYFIDLLNPFFNTSEEWFRLVPNTGCTPPPEIETNVAGNSDSLKGDVNDPVRGFVDPHTHITSYEFMGGRFMHGYPFHPWGVETALSDSSNIHGPWGSLDIIGNLQAYGDVNYRYDTRGYPDFPHWPNHRQMSHMGYYYKWIERAYLGGQRMIVTHLVENEVLCNMQSTVNPASWVGHNSCNTMDSIRLQIQRLNEMQSYIDAQEGGIGKGWFRIVTSPEQAREVIADGKLAVLIGVEASETFNCGVKDHCTRHGVETQLQALYEQGVRVLYPTHKFDNKFGGSRVEDGLINAGQWLSSGYFFDTKECDAHTHGPSMTSGFPELGSVPVIGDIINGIAGNPQYEQGIEHCNDNGLTELGVYLVNRMIDMKMLIELDHMSEETASSVLDITEARGYSGVISSHSWMTAGKNGELHNNLKRAIQAGGFVTPYNWDAHSISNSISRYLDEVEQTPYVNGVSFGTDMSGLGNQPGPRYDAGSNPLEYPFTTEFGLVVNEQQSGNRTYNYNNDGMAHYGMVADHLQDIREQAPTRIYEAIMNSAEAYLQMWERAEANTNTAYHNPLELYVRIVGWDSGRCMGVPGDDDNLYDGQNVALWDCQPQSEDQQWIYDKSARTLRNRADSSMCLDNKGQTWNGGGVGVWQCIDNHSNMQWVFDGYWLRNANNQNYVADAYGSGNGGNVGQWWFHGGNNQAWELRTDREVYVWTTYRTHQGGRCLDLPSGNTANGNALKLDRCHGGDNQQWYYNPKDGTVRSKLNWNKCVDLSAQNTSNNTQVQIWDCNGGNAQKWDHDNGYFRLRANHNKVIDANGNYDRAEVTIWDYNGGSNQRWRPVLN